MKPFFPLLICALGLHFFSLPQSGVIPTPEFYQKSDGQPYQFTVITADITSLPTETIEVLHFWNQTFKHLSERTPVSAPIALKVRFHHSENNHQENDHYEMSFDGKFVDVSYTSDASLLYAYSTLLQLIEDNGEESVLHPFTLKDRAKFPWRGLHLDVCRHFFTVDEVKRYIDIMAFYKYNTFHWHLTDDQGWRIEIKKYPLLTEIGGFRDSTLNDHYSTVPRTWNTQRYGGFYTQEQVKEVVKYAAARGVTIVPEIEMPGHSRAALAAYPEHSCTGLRQPVTGLWGVFDDIFCSGEETITFLQDILSEVLELFPSQYIHIGGDEAPKTRWKQCEKCQSNIRKYNLRDEHELQSWFIQQIDRFLTEKGRKLIGWDEILEGGLSPNAAVMSWRGEEGGIEAASQQHEVVMTPGSHCYFDHYQGEPSNEPIAFGGYTPLEKVYEFNPVPAAISEENRKYILGAQANLWTEYIPDFKQVEYMVYPRALAMIQNLWSTEKPSYHSFLSILKDKQLALLSARNINYSISFAKPTFSLEKNTTGITLTASPEKARFTHITHPERTIFHSEDSLQVNQLHFSRKKNGADRLHIEASDADFNSISSVDLIRHKGLGLDVDFITPPHKRYSTNKELTLVDGISGHRPWNGKQWLGFNEGMVEFIVTLDKQITYRSVTVSMLDASGSWIHLPLHIELYTSSNGKKWKKIAEQRVSGEQTKIRLKGKAKQLKFRITPLESIPDGFPGAGYKPFTFLDELIFE